MKTLIENILLYNSYLNKNNTSQNKIYIILNFNSKLNQKTIFYIYFYNHNFLYI